MFIRWRYLKALVFLLAFVPLSGYAALSAGDIAFVQYNADSTDNFAFVALVNIPAGEQILFSDNGWLGNNSGFRTGEGIITWTAPTGGVTAGTVVTITTTPSATGTLKDKGSLATRLSKISPTSRNQ